MPGSKSAITTSRLLSAIRGARFAGDAIAYHNCARDPVFHERLYQKMQEKGASAQDMIARTGIERSYYYHILTGSKLPGRNMVLRICLALELPLDETGRMLSLAGAGALYARVRRDALLIFALQHKLGMQAANDLLLTQGEAALLIKS